MPRTAKSTSTFIYQLKITLRGAKPPIWRRVLVPGNSTLYQLHNIIQTVMGWTDSHLHVFDDGSNQYSDPDMEVEDALSEKRAHLDKIAPAEKAKFRYEYDFGDSWEHEILVEKILPPEPGKSYPVCIKGARACPPEDCGGVWGYADLLETLADPQSEDYADMVEWLGEGFDPEAFDLDEINDVLSERT